MNPITSIGLRAEMLIPPLPWDKPIWRQREGDTVILLHGLLRGRRAMEPLARHLSRQGFSTLNLPYPSASLPAEELIRRIQKEVAVVAKDRPVHFLTHSLGGILARMLLDRNPSWQSGRLLMLAPPSSGSEIVDRLGANPIFSRCVGPTGLALNSKGLPLHLPPLPAQMEAAVIMGRRSSLPFFRKLLDEDNDGIVSVAKGRFDGLKGFSVVDADHTFISLHPEVWEKSARFFHTGEWRD